MNPKSAIILTVCLLTGFTLPVSAQKWVKMMQDPEVNFYDVQKEFYRDQKEHDKEELRERKTGKKFEENEEEESYMQFKRWEDYMEPRVYPSGKRPDPAFIATQYQNYMEGNTGFNNKTSSLANWSILGP